MKSLEKNRDPAIVDVPGELSENCRVALSNLRESQSHLKSSSAAARNRSAREDKAADAMRIVAFPVCEHRLRRRLRLSVFPRLRGCSISGSALSAANRSRSHSADRTQTTAIFATTSLLSPYNDARQLPARERLRQLPVSTGAGEELVRARTGFVPGWQT